MRLAPTRLAVGFTLLTFALAGCGGASKVVVDDAPGAPVKLTVPGTANALAPAPTATPTVAATTTPAAGQTTDNSTTAQAPTPTATPQASDGTAGGGTAAPGTTTDGTTNDQPPPAGSNAQQFEDFCTQNPGAC